MMRNAGARNWVRFHSLPGSKRYAETDEQKATLLARQNQLALDVLGESGSVWLVQACWSSPGASVNIPDENDVFRELRPDPFWACRALGLTFAYQFVEADDGDDSTA
jgi:hypothetical protein